MHKTFEKRFIFLGLIQLLLAMVVPFYSPFAVAKEGIAFAHVIGIIQGLLYFSFAWIWPKLVLPRFSNGLAVVSVHAAFWSNWIGTLLVAIFGSGKSQFILNHGIPGYHGFWNVLTLFLLNLSNFIIVAIILAAIGIYGDKMSHKSRRCMDICAGIFASCLMVFSVVQTMHPSLSNG